jgi:hypothetical protein
VPYRGDGLLELPQMGTAAAEGAQLQHRGGSLPQRARIPSLCVFHLPGADSIIAAESLGLLQGCRPAHDRQPSRGEDSVPRRSYWWPALVAVVVLVLALSGCQTGASGKHAGTSVVAGPTRRYRQAAPHSRPLLHRRARSPSSATGPAPTRCTWSTPTAAACGSSPRFRSGELGRPVLSPNGKSVVFDRAKTRICLGSPRRSADVAPVSWTPKRSSRVPMTESGALLAAWPNGKRAGPRRCAAPARPDPPRACRMSNCT